MAFPPHFYSNYNHNNFSNGFYEFPGTVVTGEGGSLAMWCQENLPYFDNINGVAANYMVPSESDISLSSVSTMSLPEDEGHGAWNMTLMPEFNMGFDDGTHQQEVCHEFGDECSALVQNLWPKYSPASNSSEIQGKTVVRGSEELAIKIGRYSVEERRERILRYLKKRNQRNFNKTIKIDKGLEFISKLHVTRSLVDELNVFLAKYVCRKTLADKRVRVRGRFAKNCEASGDEIVTKTNFDLQQDSFYSNAFQIKHDDDEDWLEAISSFLYLPYSSG